LEKKQAILPLGKKLKRPDEASLIRIYNCILSYFFHRRGLWTKNTIFNRPIIPQYIFVSLFYTLCDRIFLFVSLNGSSFNPVFDKAIAYYGTKFMIIERPYDKVPCFVFLVLFLLSFGCAKKTTIVLLPDPDSKMRHITVSTDAGATNITQVREATVVKGHESLPTSPKILESIDSKNSQNISVIGHSDTAIDPQYNLQLLRRRDSAISCVLVQKGVNSTYIKSTSHGEAPPW